jgi:hypothetical protein
LETTNKEMKMKKLTWKNGEEVHYGKMTAVIDREICIRGDYDNPRTHKALTVNGKIVRVIIDHNATGTATAGTGDTVVRSVPRGWRSGDRTFAD